MSAEVSIKKLCLELGFDKFKRVDFVPFIKKNK